MHIYIYIYILPLEPPSHPPHPTTYVDFWTGFWGLLLLSCRSSLCVLDINPISDIWFTNIFSLSVDYLSTLLIVFFVTQKLFWWNPFYLFFLLCLCFWSHIQEITIKSNLMKMFSCVFFKSFMVLALTLRSLVHFELIFVYCVR